MYVCMYVCALDQKQTCLPPKSLLWLLSYKEAEDGGEDEDEERGISVKIMFSCVL